MLTGYRIALVEDDEFMGLSLVQRLELEGAEVLWLRQVVRAVGALRTPRAPIDAVICDIRLPDGSGEALYETLLRTSIPPPFLFITGHGGIEQAVRLIQAGATDYITKPFDMAVFLERLTLLLAKLPPADLPPVLGISPAARRVDELAVQMATQDNALMIRGGPGTGKGLVARRIHALSERCAAPFITVNLAREPDAGAALLGPDGAVSRVGEGVLYLHAVERLDEALQVRLLAALESGFRGRVIAAHGAGAEGVLSEFSFRLGMAELAIPPLASRPEDAVWLMAQMFDALNARRDSPLSGINRLTEEAVRTHDWPGGGRELRARLARGVASAREGLLQPLDLFPEHLVQPSALSTLAQARETAERSQIIKALDMAQGQMGQAAKLLGISRTTLWEKMQKLGIRRTDS